jgi:SSS family solute:Na+ symporter/sodium/proline symporter
MEPDASNKRILIVSRLMVVLLGVWALYQSLHTESVLKKSLYAYTIYSAALTPVILATFFWKRTTSAAAVISIAAGTLVTVTWDSMFVHRHLPRLLTDRDAIFPALLTSLLCLVVVSLITPKPTPAQLAPFAEG